MKRLCLMLIVLVLATGVSHADWTFRDVSERITSTIPDARSVAWGDVNNDGVPDLFVGGNGQFRGKLYVNESGLLNDRTQEYGLSTPYTFNAYGAQFVDFDQDGYTDLLLLLNSSHGFIVLRQLPNHRFQAMQNNTHVVFNGRITSANWFDVNGDNALDLILSNGSFDTSAAMVVTPQSNEVVQSRDTDFMECVRKAGAIAIEDFDQDGDADIFIGSNGEAANPARLFCKTPTGYEDFSSYFSIPPMTGISGAVWFDYNNDQQLDLLTLGSGENTYLMRGKAVNGMHGLAVVPSGVLVSAARNARFVHAVDADMDGWTDLFFVESGTPGCKLLKNDRGQGWIDVTAAIGLNRPYPMSSCAWADWDGDGDLDLLAAHESYGVRLYANDTENRHEFILLNLLSSATHASLTNCTAWMQFETAKAVGSTYLRTASMGCDARSMLLVNSSDYKSGVGKLHVTWPNGVHSVHPLGEVILNRVNYLAEPDAVPPAPLAAVSSRGSVQLIVSPNPFNPTTKLSYTLPEAADVKLQVFNLMGQEVATLVSEPQAAGTHQISFNAAELPTGLYLSRLTAGGESHISRLLLTK